MKKMLILGGNGFVGKNLIEYLNQFSNQYQLFAPTSRELDLLDEKQVRTHLEKNNYDVIVNAAIHNHGNNPTRERQRELEYDLRMFYNLEKYQSLYGKMLYFGSGAEFDKSCDIHNASDDYTGLNIPLNQYGLAKYIIAKTIEQSRNIYNLRIFGLFGKYENWKTTFISGACCKAIKGVPITIRQNVLFDYLYIEDFCKMIGWFLEHEPTWKSYNVVSGRKVDLLTITDCVLKKSQKALPVYVCKEGLAKEYTASNERLLQEIGDFNFTPMEEAISQLYDWYSMHQNEIDLYSLLYQNG